MEKKCLILGAAKSGIAAANFLLSLNKKIILVDKDTSKDEIKIFKDIEIFKDDADIDFEKIEIVILSPGISSEHKLVKEANKNLVEVIGEIELGVRFIKNRVIAITGTKGKTTLTSLITHILNFSNIKAKALGNIGEPLTKYLLNWDIEDTIVLELSSFQIESLKKRFIDIAVIINIMPDHLDRYESFEEYKKAKIKIIEHLKDDGILYTTDEVLKFLNIKNVKIVDEELNLIAKKICLDLKVDKVMIDNAIKTFIRPKHRMEFILEIDGVKFYNDSKSTNIESTIYAVNLLKENIILIAGGVDKKLNFDKWKSAFKSRVKKIFALGEVANVIKKELENFDVEICFSLKEAVEKAFFFADKKDSVLLSPGTSSYDMFKDFEHRGNEFKKIVNNLKGDRCLEEIL